MTRKRVWMHLSMLLLLAGGAGPSSAADLFDGPNCNVMEPPAEAGDFIAPKGSLVPMTGRIFPRLSSMPSDYTGCQVLWSVINNGPRSRTLIAIRGGRVEDVRPRPLVPLCAPREKTIDTGCSPRQLGLLASFPAGCAGRAADAGRIPADCMQAFQRDYAILDAMEE
jgi:hypothetical protein